MYIAVLAVFPAAIQIGTDTARWNRIFLASKLKNMDTNEVALHLGGVGTVLGAWVSAIVIPLDWDRWWQVIFSN